MRNTWLKPIRRNIAFDPNIFIRPPDKIGLIIAPKANVKIREEFNSAISFSLQKSFACAALIEKIGKVDAPNKKIFKKIRLI